MKQSQNLQNNKEGGAHIAASAPWFALCCSHSPRQLLEADTESTLERPVADLGRKITQSGVA
jgi:hypothetical protein